ncbi:uncharacterized protein LOC133795718 [Humulus lupulus]|uniref:uncharacterized protein LOC133795718 n=1 Tax=Humulus lupulus TaxID=3486 RepID=UPI002B4071F8|nr:uncharacterized protein LOC133795718 [Humulus lupulus]
MSTEEKDVKRLVTVDYLQMVGLIPCDKNMAVENSEMFRHCIVPPAPKRKFGEGSGLTPPRKTLMTFCHAQQRSVDYKELIKVLNDQLVEARAKTDALQSKLEQAEKTVTEQNESLKGLDDGNNQQNQANKSLTNRLDGLTRENEGLARENEGLISENEELKQEKEADLTRYEETCFNCFYQLWKLNKPLKLDFLTEEIQAEELARYSEMFRHCIVPPAPKRKFGEGSGLTPPRKTLMTFCHAQQRSVDYKELIKVLNDQLVEARAKTDALQSKLEQAEKTVTEQNESLKGLDDGNNQQNQANKSLTNRLDGLTRENEGLARENEGLISENEELKQEKEADLTRYEETCFNCFYQLWKLNKPLKLDFLTEEIQAEELARYSEMFRHCIVPPAPKRKFGEGSGLTPPRKTLMTFCHAQQRSVDYKELIKVLNDQLVEARAKTDALQSKLEQAEKTVTEQNESLKGLDDGNNQQNQANKSLTNRLDGLTRENEGLARENEGLISENEELKQEKEADLTRYEETCFNCFYQLWKLNKPLKLDFLTEEIQAEELARS